MFATSQLSSHARSAGPSPGRSARRRRGWLAAGLVAVIWTASCGARTEIDQLVADATATGADSDNGAAGQGRAGGGSVADDGGAAGDPGLSGDGSATGDGSANGDGGPTGGGAAADGAPPPGSTIGDMVGQPACPVARCVSIAVTGDVLLHPPLVEQAAANAGGTGRDLDFAPMLAAQRPYLESADLAICHLETPVAEPEGPFEGYPMFSVPPQVLAGLVSTGYDACTTASNHTLDQGVAGAVRTLDALDAAGLAHDGSYRTAAEAATPTVIQAPATRIGLISVTYGLNTGDPDQPWMVPLLDAESIIARARAARAAGADIVIVAMHAGTEYETEPNSEQRAAAQALLADPAIDLLYGHHAHVVQPMEQINGKWVIYGLGNMLASHETPIDATREGLLVRVTFGVDGAGAWRTTDVAWVPSLQDVAGVREWCPLTADAICTSAAAHDTALSRTTEVVNLYGADLDGAHRWELG